MPTPLPRRNVALNDASIGSMFLEGFATWAAGEYWLDWQGATSFQSAQRLTLRPGLEAAWLRAITGAGEMR